MNKQQTFTYSKPKKKSSKWNVALSTQWWEPTTTESSPVEMVLPTRLAMVQKRQAKASNKYNISMASKVKACNWLAWALRVLPVDSFIQGVYLTMGLFTSGVLAVIISLSQKTQRMLKTSWEGLYANFRQKSYSEIVSSRLLVQGRLVAYQPDENLDTKLMEILQEHR